MIITLSIFNAIISLEHMPYWTPHVVRQKRETNSTPN